MKKVICECGSSKWILKECISYACIPPIHADIYECAKCGKTYEKRTQSSLQEYYPEIEIWDNEPISMNDDTSIKTRYEDGESEIYTTPDLTSIDGFESAEIKLKPKLPGRLGTLPRLEKNITVVVAASK